ncbi:MAG: DedA family protein, partial [bacterium]|nr:DedA family protein [bacterium]
MNIFKRLYDWVIHWADTRYGTPALAGLAFAESSFFPIPADVLLIALCLGKPKKSFYYAFICTLFSVLGGVFGYFIGLWFMDVVGIRILELYGAMERYNQIGEWYRAYDAWAVGIAGFTPIPYKVFTIAAGAIKPPINLTVFILASIVGRSGRFFVVSALFYFYGPPIKKYIDKYFNILAVIFVILLVGGFFILKILL